MPWGGGDCTLSLAWEDATMMPLQHYGIFQVIDAVSHYVTMNPWIITPPPPFSGGMK
jgi:hypothetical protein